MTSPHITSRRVSSDQRDALVREGVHPVLAQVFAGRGVRAVAELSDDLAHLLPPRLLTNAETAARLLADAIAAGKRMLIVADYDCDGATACALGIRALRMFGARVDYLVPNRFEYGYGLTPEIVRLAAGQKAEQKPDLIITVDNGIASVEGVDEANRLGIEVLVTDHHLPGEKLPAAACIVNPNQPYCAFPSKHLAGVGVMFYVMLALRSELRNRGAFTKEQEPNLGTLLDLVALGTVADVVRLDANNRILVSQGLKRIREGRMQPGIRALFAAAGREVRNAATFDLGFALGPRLNAAGRLTDMRMGIECLIEDDNGRALGIAQELDRLNQERRDIEADMRDTAAIHLATLAADAENSNAERFSVALFDAEWHQGVIGIVAGRLKDALHRPVIVFARGINGEIKGSGRSIAALHLRDALDLVSKRLPGLILKFGGHAAAAGLTIRESDFDIFRDAFERVAAELLTPADLSRVVETDGALESGYFNLQTAQLLAGQIWGQGFPLPLFRDRFEVDSQKILKERHSKLRVRKLGSDGPLFDAIFFNHVDPLPSGTELAYRLDVNEFNGVSRVQLIIEHAVIPNTSDQAL